MICVLRARLQLHGLAECVFKMTKVLYLACLKDLETKGWASSPNLPHIFLYLYKFRSKVAPYS